MLVDPAHHPHLCSQPDLSIRSSRFSKFRSSIGGHAAKDLSAFDVFSGAGAVSTAFGRRLNFAAQCFFGNDLLIDQGTAGHASQGSHFTEQTVVCISLVYMCDHGTQGSTLMLNLVEL